MSGPKTDTRNIIDPYKYWTTEAILADLDEKRHNFSVLCCNIQGDFNLSTIVRNSNAFLAKQVIIYGKKKWDRRGAVGTQNYTNFKHVCEADDSQLDELLKDCHVIGIDNVENAKPINKFDWNIDKHIVMCFGEENSGLPKEILDICDDIVYIEQYGSVRSLNVGCASSIAMFDFCSKRIV